MANTTEVRWRHTWATGCTPRVAVFNCSDDVRLMVRVMKSITLASQLFLLFVVSRSLCRDREQLHDSRGALQIVTMGFCFIGGLHSLSLVGEIPNDISQEVLLFLVEYLYSLFTALMIGAMGCLNCVWLEFYHKEAFPAAETLRQKYLQRMQLATKCLLSLTVLTSLASDTFLVANPSTSSFVAVTHVQHYVYVLICLVAVPATITMMRMSVRAGSSPAAGPISTNVSLSRLLTAQWIISFLWLFCVFFCMFCGVGGTITKATNQDPGTAILLAWLSHASFNFTAGGVIGSYAMTMIHKPALLDKVSWLFRPPCCCLVSPALYNFDVSAGIEVEGKPDAQELTDKSVELVAAPAEPNEQKTAPEESLVVIDSLALIPDKIAGSPSSEYPLMNVATGMDAILVYPRDGVYAGQWSPSGPLGCSCSDVCRTETGNTNTEYFVYACRVSVPTCSPTRGPQRV